MKSIFLFFLVVAPLAIFGQKIKIMEGSLKPLKGQNSILVEFNYDSMLIGRDVPEKIFIEKKKSEIDQKQAGKGDEWEKVWYDSRVGRYEGTFRQFLEKTTGMSTSQANSKYTIIFKTLRTEPGWNAVAAAIPGEIDAEALLVETADKSKVIARVLMSKMRGESDIGGDFEVGIRVQKAYAYAAKELGTLINNKTGRIN